MLRLRRKGLCLYIDIFTDYDTIVVEVSRLGALNFFMLGEFVMKISKKEVVDAILNNDTASVTEMLEGFDLTKDAPHFTSADKELVSTMLSPASAMAWRDDLDGDLAQELIERTAMTVDIFPFLQLVVTGVKIEVEDFDVIPQKIRTALCRNNYCSKIAHAIEELSDEAFSALLVFLLSGQVESVHVKFNLPIIRRIYMDNVMPAALVFVYMALCLRDTIDDCMRKLNEAFGGLLFGEFLNEICSDRDDDEK